MMNDNKVDKKFLVMCAVSALPVVIFKTQFSPQIEKVVFLWYVLAVTLSILLYSYNEYAKSRWFQVSIFTAFVAGCATIFSLGFFNINKENLSYYVLSIIVGLPVVLIVMAMERICKK